MTPGQGGGTPRPGGRSPCRGRGTAPATSGCFWVFAGAGTSRPRCARGTAKETAGRGVPHPHQPPERLGQSLGSASPQPSGCWTQPGGAAGLGRRWQSRAGSTRARATPSDSRWGVVLPCWSRAWVKSPAWTCLRTSSLPHFCSAPPSAWDGFNSEKGSGACFAHVGFLVHGITHPSNPSL